MLLQGDTGFLNFKIFDMANFDIAWEITAIHEGSKYDTTIEDEGNIYNGVVYGSKYGITAKFLREQVKLKLSEITPTLIKNLTKSQAGVYAKKGTWDLVMKGNQFINQEVANLVFDWVHQRPGTAIAKIAGICGSNTVEIEEMLDYLQLSDKVIRKINLSQPRLIFLDILASRLDHVRNSGKYKANKEGVLIRVLSFQKRVPKASTRKFTGKDSNNTDNTNDIGSLLLQGFGLYMAWKYIFVKKKK